MAKRKVVKPRNTKKRMEKILGILTLVKKMKGMDMKYLSDNLSDEAIELLSECVYNSITNIKDQKKRLLLKRRLFHDKDNFRFISKPRNDLKKKRELIPQMGQGLGLIASLLIPLVSSVIQAVVPKPKANKNKNG